MSEKYSTNGAILREFYPEKQIKVTAEGAELIGKIAADDVIDPVDGEIFVEAGQTIKDVTAAKIAHSSLKGKNIVILDTVKDPLILNSLEEDNSETHEQALLKIYQRLRAGNPPQLEKPRRVLRGEVFRF